jgi:AcrR family transcriptional regulator
MSKPAVKTTEDGRFLRGNRTREQLLWAALELFGTRGFHATSMKDLATAAGVSPPSIYNHFSSKESLLVAALVECLLQFQASVVDPDDETLPSLLRLEGLVRRHVALQTKRTAHVRVVDRLLDSVQAGELLAEGAGSGIQDLLRRYRQLISELIDDLREEYELSLPAAPVCTAALLALCDRAHLWLPPGATDSIQAQNECWYLVSGMLGIRS